MKKAIHFKVPDTLVLILSLMAIAWLITGIIPVGSFSTKTVTYEYNNQQFNKEILDSASFQYNLGGEGKPVTQMPDVFDGSEKTGLLNAVYDGLTVGNRNGGAVGIIAFLIIIGGSFGMIMAPTSIHRSMVRLLVITKGHDLLAIPLLCFLFSLGGAVFGMGEEAIAFAMLLTPIMKTQGYNGILAVLCTYVSTQIGFATSWMNPFNVAIAQGLAGVPILSGMTFRLVMWCVFTLGLMVFVTYYANSIKQRGEEFDINKISDNVKLSIGDKFILLNLVLGLTWVIWGVVEKGYYIAEIASQFFTIGLSSAIITVFFKLDQLNIDAMAKAFQKGASDLIPAALIVGFAQGILLILGGADPTVPSTLNTILFNASQAIEGLPEVLSAVSMLAFQSVFNFFVTSGSAQAALTMPLLAPIADLVDVTRQTAVLTFQLGDGLTNIIVPTSAALMGSLGAAKITWNDWAGFIWKFLLFNFILAVIFVIIAVLTGF